MSLGVLECPPYKARLTEASCDRNRERARDAAANPKREGSPSVLLSLRACVRCCGVVELARMWSREPDAMDVSKLTPPRSMAQRRSVSVAKPQIEGPRIGRSIGEPATVPPGAKRGGRRA